MKYEGLYVCDKFEKMVIEDVCTRFPCLCGFTHIICFSFFEPQNTFKDCFLHLKIQMIFSFLFFVIILPYGICDENMVLFAVVVILMMTMMVMVR